MSVLLPAFTLSLHARYRALTRSISRRAIGLALAFGSWEPDGRTQGGRRYVLDRHAVREAPGALKRELNRWVGLVVVAVPARHVVTVFRGDAGVAR